MRDLFPIPDITIFVQKKGREKKIKKKLRQLKCQSFSFDESEASGQSYLLTCVKPLRG